nr:unnamed protein product [Spirometra erinaceieuropaei]
MAGPAHRCVTTTTTAAAAAAATTTTTTTNKNNTPTGVRRTGMRTGEPCPPPVNPAEVGSGVRELPAHTRLREPWFAEEAVKAALASATVLAHPRADVQLALMTAASNTAVGASLQKTVSGVLQPLAFFSKKLSQGRPATVPSAEKSSPSTYPSGTSEISSRVANLSF